MKKIIVFLFVLTVMLSMMLTCAYADDCSLGKSPEGVYALDNNEITMTDEDIKVYPLKGYTECTFEFQNSGDEKDVLMGFPNVPDEIPENSDADRMSYSDFTANDGSTSLKVELLKSAPSIKYKGYSSWFTFNVHFKKGEKKIINNSYKFNTTVYSTGDNLVGYIIDTGAVWKDKIGHAKVTFFLPDLKPYEISSLQGDPYFHMESGKVTWERYNFEPARNIEVLYNERNKFIDGLSDPDFQKQYKDELNELINTENSINKMDKNQLVKFIHSRGDYQQYDGLKQEALDELIEQEPQYNKRIFMKIGDAVFDINGITFQNDNAEAAAAPEIREGRTFVPLRFIVENMDGEVQWDGQLKKITIKAKENTIVLKIGEKTIWENEVPKSIDAAPVIVNGRTIVPVRFIAESLGMKVDWLESDQIILISGKQ